MRKKRFTKFGIIIVGLAIVSMLMFSFPLMGAAAIPEETKAAEETSIKEDLDDIQEEVEDIDDENGEDLEEAKKGDADEADENLPGGGHEDPNGVNVENEFEGIE
ncbi:MAG: hypothetical protein WA097_04865 [Candidatus Hydromicrobium sp.]